MRGFPRKKIKNLNKGQVPFFTDWVTDTVKWRAKLCSLPLVYKLTLMALRTFQKNYPRSESFLTDKIKNPNTKADPCFYRLGNRFCKKENQAM